MARLLGIALGILAGLGVLEAALRPFSTPLDRRLGSVPVSYDSTDGWTGTVRFYHEGVATAHFSAANARLTGHPWIAGGPVVVLLGDSHVEALQVTDLETMGSVLESLGRASGVSLDVRQYGWNSASTSQYVAIAPAIVRRWPLGTIVVTLNRGDLEAASLQDEPNAKVAADTTLTVLAPPIQPPTAPPPRSFSSRVRDAILHRSALLTEVRRRMLLIGSPASGSSHAPPDAPLIPAAAVRSLRRAYGDRLLVVYAPGARISGAQPDRARERLFAACVANGVRCVDPSDLMQRARAVHGISPRGFDNSPAGEGHLNATGHAAMAQAIWNAIANGPWPAQSQPADSNH